jgi:PAS domain S-box-containing protein
MSKRNTVSPMGGDGAVRRDHTSDLQLLIDSTPGLIHTGRPDGYLDFFNQTWLRYVGQALEDLQGWKWTASIHPEDVDGIVERWRASLASGEPFVYETRVRRADGEYRWMLHHKVAVLDGYGQIVKWYGSSIDIEDRKRAEVQLRQSAEELQRSEFYLAEGQRLAHMGSWAFDPAGFDYWSPELFRMYGLDPDRKPPTLQEYLDCVHPQDRESMANLIQGLPAKAAAFDATKRIVRPDGEVRYVRCVGVPAVENESLKKYVGSAIDVTEHELLTQELRRREAYLAEAQRLSHTGSFGWKPDSGEIEWSDETYRIFEYDRAERPTLDMVSQRIHPQDRALAQQVIEGVSSSTDFEHEYRLVMPSAAIKHIHVRAHALPDSSGDIEVVGAVTDITERKTAEEKIREQEMELRQILDFVPWQVAVLSADGKAIYLNKAGLDYHGLTREAFQDYDPHRLIHPDDHDRILTGAGGAKLLSGEPFENEARLLRKDGKYRWFLFQFDPLRDGEGRITRWYVTNADIEDRKQAEERLQNENVALREEIDKASMFEEIVGTSRSLKAVLSRIAKVAPTDSTVLITGETGTGKELIARAVHKRSQRSGRPFVSVNCAALPPALVSSELFGHEKGAFTGASQRRLGRFEMADGGTIFLDEVGELLPDTQAALLRVLQEREFERVGGDQPLQVDVRVIAATNRDLTASVANGTFRKDLLYRLNVFPIEVPPLRERKDDILMLVEYFVQRYANRVGRNIRSIDQKTLELLQSYDWPGNIRELQNIIERSMIVSSGHVFAVDELWLSNAASPAPPRVEASAPLKTEATPRTEREIIEAALAESRGRVSGPAGAAAKLRIPASTLESRIKALKIRKSQFKFV